MWARVTAGAVLEGDRAEYRHRSPRGVGRRAEPCSEVTFRAGDVIVLAGQWIVCLRVVERRRVLPAAGVVAPRARARERTPVRIGMAACAVALEPDPSRARSSRRERRGGRRAESRRMTRGALGRRVTLFQRVAGAACVIEALRRAAGPLDELEIAARVVGMARRACPLSGTARVESALLLAEPRDLLVTRQAALGRRLGAPAVALHAVRGSLERGMRPRERARGDLCLGAPSDQCQRSEHDDAARRDRPRRAPPTGRGSRGAACVSQRSRSPSATPAPWSRVARRAARGARTALPLRSERRRRR